MADVTFKSNANEILKQLEKAEYIGLNRVGQFVVGEAQKITPVGTPQSTGIPGYIGGTLKQSITYSTKEQAGKTKQEYQGKDVQVTNNEEKSVIIGTGVEYAPYVELGANGKTARPYLRPAIDNNRKEIKDILQNALSGNS